MYRSLLLISSLLSVFTLQVKAQIPSYRQPIRQDIRLDATIQNKMSTEEFMLKLAQIRQMRDENNREAAVLCAARTNSLYQSVTSFPGSISDGWYNVTFNDGISSCGDRKVYVKGNRISRWIVDNIYEKDVIFSSPIDKGKSIVRLTVKDGETPMLNVYFLENIIDPSARATEPQSGSVSFWTDYKRLKGAIEIYVDDQLIGELNSYFESQPNCEQQGVLTFTYKPGSYSYTAKSANLTWKGSIQVNNGQCSLMRLTH